ncbi:MAG: GntR family transcriptional regulator [Actinomycetota bacterium]
MQSNPTVEYIDRNGAPRRLVIRLDRGSTVPPFEQLRAQLSVMVAVGRLEPGSKLPTVRQLAEQLDLAPGTVARAYRELEHEGSAVARGRAGTFVAEEPPHSEPLRERRERVAALADRFVFDLDQLGLGSDAIATAVTEALERTNPVQ